MYLERIHFCFKINLFILLYFIKGTSNKALRIIGGRDAVPGEFPYVVKMEVKVDNNDGIVHYTHLCTCTLLKPTWSITAGHCVEELLKVLKVSPVVKGVIKYNTSSNQGPVYKNIISTFLHPNFHIPMNTFYNDIGLLFSEEIAVSTFAKLSSVDYVTLYGSKILALGYGITKGANGSYGDAHSVNKPLQVLDAVIIRCYELNVFPSFCLGGVCNQWSALCPGDSGGPVLHESGLVGVNTATQSIICMEKLALDPSFKFRNYAGWITPGSPYIDWVTNVIK